jgi:DNA-binding transcriptional MocR family regulator
VLERATELGTSFDPGRLFRRDEDQRAFAMRLSPCNVPEASIDQAVLRLSRALSGRGRAGHPGPRRRSARAAPP